VNSPGIVRLTIFTVAVSLLTSCGFDTPPSLGHSGQSPITSQIDQPSGQISIQDTKPPQLPSGSFPGDSPFKPVDDLGYVVAADAYNRTIDLDRVTFHECDSIEMARPAGGSCDNNYQISNKNTLIRRYRVTDSARFVAVDDNANKREIDWNEFVDKVAGGKDHTVYAFQIDATGAVLTVGGCWEP
jgi:hypothetical protein